MPFEGVSCLLKKDILSDFISTTSYMDQSKSEFVRRDIIPLLRRADPSLPAVWGKMSFQHMVEHLVLSVKNANGKIKTQKVFTPVEKLPASRKFLMSDQEFRQNTKSPAFPEEPLPLHFPSAKEGIDKLERELADFFLTYESHPGIMIDNPVFGALNYDEAVQLLYKHTRHHLKQFGLLNS